MVDIIDFDDGLSRRAFCALSHIQPAPLIVESAKPAIPGGDEQKNA